ncbi:hypothetical protein Anas_08350 [Armadillidium nasatum]|uniref:Uncharacterized protein n=1 Tax=Armadillidium nasatum TaxID=96803 RepID=A0A5N5SU58_9CRUS|nr:hypothetical protein Anas_08674 [Armadillidium nasatum]KAB7497445.1 hypothetical protein Anas_08350 [Armadillidium nasatum]
MWRPNVKFTRNKVSNSMCSIYKCMSHEYNYTGAPPLAYIENRISEILEKEIGGVYKSKEKSKVVGTNPYLFVSLGVTSSPNLKVGAPFSSFGNLTSKSRSSSLVVVSTFFSSNSLLLQYFTLMGLIHILFSRLLHLVGCNSSLALILLICFLCKKEIPCIQGIYFMLVQRTGRKRGGVALYI